MRWSRKASLLMSNFRRFLRISSRRSACCLIQVRDTFLIASLRLMCFKTALGFPLRQATQWRKSEDILPKGKTSKNQKCLWWMIPWQYGMGWRTFCQVAMKYLGSAPVRLQFGRLPWVGRIWCCWIMICRSVMEGMYWRCFVPRRNLRIFLWFSWPAGVTRKA